MDEGQNFPSGTAESNSNAESVENNPAMRQDAAADISNKEILAASAGITVTQTIETSAGGVISIDAQVDVDGISRVSRYRYIPLQFTDDIRKAMLRKRFPAENWDVNEAAVYNEKDGAWEFVTPRGESWLYQVADTESPDEQTMNLERVDERPEYGKGSKVSSVRMDGEFMEIEDMLLLEVTGCVPREIEQLGRIAIETIAGIGTYTCNYIHIYKDGGGHMYARAVFKQMIDGMPVTAWHNFSTITTENSGRFPAKEWGSLFSVEETGLDKQILTPAEAVTAMQEQMDSVQIQDTQMYVTKISLEYLAVISSKGTPEIVPVWRFWPGNDEMERGLMCGQIFAVNAVSGELIWENRDDFA